MTQITLPYNLQDGQRAYAARIMANFRALAGQLNRVSVEGLAEGDLENVLLQIKLLLDELSADQARTLSAVSYDPATQQLQLTLRNGALYQLDMSPFIDDYQGSSGQTVDVSVDSAGVISAQLAPGGVGEEHLADSLLDLIAGKVTASSRGNASQILFSDGESFQDKLDAGRLQGADGVSVALAGIYYLRYDQGDGHLYVGVADGAQQPPLSIDSSGHLIYTIE